MATYPGTNELLTLAEYKSLTGTSATAYDTFLTSQIPAVSRAIETFCRRRFLSWTWTQWVPVDRELLLDSWPCTNVVLLGVPYICFTIADTSNLLNFQISQPSSSTPEVVARMTVTNTSTFAVTEFLFSAFATVGALKTAVEAAFPGVVTLTYGNLPVTTTFASVNTLTLRPTSGKTVYFGANYFDQTNSNPIGDVFRLNDLSDRLVINPNLVNTSRLFSGGYDYYSTGWGNVDPNSSVNLDFYQPDDMLAVYTAGWATADVPNDLKQTVSNIIRDIVSLFDMDGSGVYKPFKSETLGDYSYDQFDNNKLSELIESKYAKSLDYYRRKWI